MPIRTVFKPKKRGMGHRDKQPMLCLSHKHTYRYRDNNSTVYGERRSGRSRYHRRAVPLSVCICSALPAV